MAAVSGGSSSFPPPCPKSPPHYPDLYGKRRETAKIQMLEREISFLEVELKSVDGFQHASKCCKEVMDFVTANSDPLIPADRKNRKSCRFWKRLCVMPCFNLSRICCCCYSECSCRLKCTPCCDCKNPCDCSPCNCSSCKCSSCNCCLCDCNSCLSCCTVPKWQCCCCSNSHCCQKISCSRNCCVFHFPSCTDCCCRWKCCCPKCPKVGLCCNCTYNCCNPRCLLF